YHVFIYTVGYARAVRNYFLNNSYIKSNMKILDAGCGGGLVTQIIHTIAHTKHMQSITFDGFDLTPAMLDMFRNWIKKNNITNISLVQANVLKPEQLPVNWNNYDLITVSGMLEHISREHITDAIKNLKNLLAPNGTLIIFISRKNWLTYWVITRWWKAETYSRAEIETIVRNAGLTRITFNRFAFPFNYLNSWVHIIEAKK
ncbi:unnamed protein product, partial [marine sediment metagenome]